MFHLFAGIFLIIVGGDQFVLAAGEKLHEVAQKLPGFRQAAEMFELQQGQVAAQQNPVVDLVDGLQFRIDFLQQGVAERVKRAERDRLGAFDFRFAAIARRRDHAMLHFRRGLVGKRQPQDFLARQTGLRIEQVANAFGDDARFSRARAGHHHQWALAVIHGGALFRIELNSRRWFAGMFEQVGHFRYSRITTVAQAWSGMWKARQLAGEAGPEGDSMLWHVIRIIRRMECGEFLVVMICVIRVY